MKKKGDVIPFLKAVPGEREPDAGVLKMAEKLVEEVKAGRVVGLATAVLLSDGGLGCAYDTGRDGGLIPLTTSVAILHRRMMDDLLGMGEW